MPSNAEDKPEEKGDSSYPEHQEAVNTHGDSNEAISSKEDVEAAMKNHRRIELLAIARKSRLRWILEAREKQVDYSSNATNAVTKTSEISIKSASQSKKDFYNKVPAASCLQEVVDFLVDMTVSDPNDDKEYINIETLAPSDTIDEELQMELSSSESLPSFDNISDMSAYSIFLEKLKHSSATDIVNALRKFVTKIEVYIRDGEYNSRHGAHQPTSSLSTPTTTLDIPMEIFSLTDQVEQMLKQNILWASETTSQFSETLLALEKLIFHKLYHCLFALITKKNAKKDESLKDRIDALAFLRPVHLDIDTPLKESSKDREESFGRLKKKLKMTEHDGVLDKNTLESSHEASSLMQSMKNAHIEGLAEAVYLLKYSLTTECYSPSAKMACLREVSRSVIATITANSKTKKPISLQPHTTTTTSTTTSTAARGKAPPGADDLLPALILAINQANPPHLTSTIDFLEAYLSPKKLFSEAGYILTHFVSAVQFLEGVNARALTISPAEYEESMERCKHGGESRRRILEEDTKMRENMFYKKAISVSTTAGRADVSFGKNSDCVTKQKSVHEVYRRLRTASTSIISTCCSHHDNRIDLDNSGRNGRDNQRPTQALVDAHQSFTASDRQTRFISAWGEGASGSAGLVNYYLKSPDMLTMSDIPRIMAEYKYLVRACAALAASEQSD